MNGKYYWEEENGLHTDIRICFTDAPGPMRPHTQSELELMYFMDTDGCLYKCGGRELRLCSGEMTVVNPGEMHACSHWGSHCRAVCLLIDVQKLWPSALRQMRYENRICCGDEARQIIDRMEAALTLADGAEKDLWVCSCVYALLAELSGHAVQQEPETSPARRAEMEDTAAYIRENLSEPLPLGLLARRVHLSGDRFYHVFREYFGVSPTEYLLTQRIRLACELLGGTRLSVTEIAQRCGFCTASYFAEKFRAYMHMTPSRYRREAGKSVFF